MGKCHVSSVMVQMVTLFSFSMVVGTYKHLFLSLVAGPFSRPAVRFKTK